MKRLMIAGLIAVVAGCGPADPNSKPPQPEIRVERTEAPTGILVKVEYGHHSGGSNNYVKLDTLQKLQSYRKQVEFLSAQLEEAEKRMSVREQSEKKPE